MPKRSTSQQVPKELQARFEEITTSDNSRKAIYSCVGKVTNDRHITLKCSENDAPNFMLDIEGFIFPDGHMEGTLVATNSFDSNYHNSYNWNVT